MSPVKQPHTRDQDEGVTVERKIPLWGLLTVLGVVAVQAIAMYITQADQGKTLLRFEKEQISQSIEFKQLRETLQAQDRDNFKLKLEFDSFRARITALEAAKK